MKVLVIFTGQLAFDGITQIMLSYYEAMDLGDVQIDFVCCRNVNEKVLSRAKSVITNFYHLPMRAKNPISYVFKLKKIIKQNHYDIIHANGSSGLLGLEMLAGFLGGCKVRIAHSHSTSCLFKLMDKIMRPLLHAFCTDRFACGKDAGKWLFGKRDFMIINNAKNLDLLLYNSDMRKSVREKYNLEDKLVIGHVGTLTDSKNHMFLIDVFEQIKIKKKKENAYLILIGDGSLREKIENQIKEYGLENSVLMMGEITNVAEIIQAVDIMVFPSRFEGLPGVVLEWQIAGIPCVISDAITRDCAFSELVKFLPLSDGAEKWADCVLDTKLPDREKERTALITAAKNAGYDIKENARRLKEKYVSLAKKSE